MEPNRPPVGRSTPPGAPADPPTPNTLTPEEVKLYKDCMYGLFYKAGLPYAAFFHILSFWRGKQAEVPPPTLNSSLLVKKTFVFFGNMLIGTFLFAPVCYRSLYEMRMNIEKRRKAEGVDFPPVERTVVQPTMRPDDYNYPTDFTSTLSDAESTFTSEYSTSKILPTEEESVKLTPRTTYQDLRSRHRGMFDRRSPEPPPAQPNVPVDKVEPRELAPVEKEPRKFVKRNKYGDEIE